MTRPHPAPTIAFQGQPGSWSHLACRRRRPHHQPLPCGTFADAFDAVREGSAALAMIPVENSAAGRVADIHHLLPESGLHIVGETFEPVRHQLLGLPGATLDGLSTVHSHAHALAQCRQLIAGRRLTPVVESDTAGAAAQVAAWGDPRRAAIASPLAGELHGLNALLPDIADFAHNTTRFVEVAAEPASPPGGAAVITSFVFEVQNLPAALYKALGGFATNGVNMLKIESSMVGGSFTSTRFYCDIAGHPEDPAVRRAFAEIGFFSRSFRILGAYPADPGRPADPPADPPES